ncbi:MAG: 2-dehydropantoate 2-reductase [Anaerolineae bacterium]|nr:2-dehydropantoate 2-reductase [Anaerolineae bacterium]
MSEVTDHQRCINRVAIMGAGALGAAYGSRLFELSPELPVFIAKGERAIRLKRQGVVVNGSRYAITVAEPALNSQPADLIIVALKHQHLHDALPDLASFIGDNTTLLSVMNGLDSEHILGARYGMEKVLYAIAVGIDALRVANTISYTTIGKIIFGEKQNLSLTPRVLAIQHILEQAGIGTAVPEDMMRMLWWKFMVNVGMNQASAVTGAPYGVFQQLIAAQQLMESLMQEVIVLAAHAGVNLVENDITEWYTFLNTLSPQGKTSMLQDIEAHRPTEVDIFGGKVIALGQQYGVATPINQAVVQIIQILEAIYR